MHAGGLSAGWLACGAFSRAPQERVLALLGLLLRTSRGAASQTRPRTPGLVCTRARAASAAEAGVWEVRLWQERGLVGDTAAALRACVAGACSGAGFPESSKAYL